MSNFNSDIAIQQASGRGDTRISGSLLSGQKRNFRATYTVAGTEAASDTITLGILPTGAQVTGGRVWTNGVGGTGATVATLGTSATANLLSNTAVAVVSAASTALTPTAGLPPAAFDGQTAVIATIGLSSGSLTAGQVIVFDIEYFV